DAISATDSRDTWLPPSGGSSPWLPPSGGRSSWRGASPLLLLLLACAVYFVALGNAAIWDANEAFYVETPREMLEGNDFVNPSFNYLPRFNKPVLSYWIVAFLYRLFGVSVGVQRFGIALGALIIIVCAYVLAHRRPRIGAGVGGGHARLRAAPRDVRAAHLHRHLDHGVPRADADLLRAERAASRTAAPVSDPHVRLGRARRADERAGRDRAAGARLHALPRRHAPAAPRHGDDDPARHRHRRGDCRAVVRGALQRARLDLHQVVRHRRERRALHAGARRAAASGAVVLPAGRAQRLVPGVGAAVCRGGGVEAAG